MGAYRSYHITSSRFRCFISKLYNAFFSSKTSFSIEGIYVAKPVFTGNIEQSNANFEAVSVEPCLWLLVLTYADTFACKSRISSTRKRYHHYQYTYLAFSNSECSLEALICMRGI